ncbi:unnamed protein product [Ectocarpus sp. 12 AP-2014]
MASLGLGDADPDNATGATRKGGRTRGGGGGARWATPAEKSRTRQGGHVGRPSTTAMVVQGGSWTDGGGEFVGERTVASHVLQDSFRSMRRKEKGGVLEYDRTKSRCRMLRLEVIWSTVSNEEAKGFLLPRGSIVERNQGRLSQFETFRALWAQDERRKSVREEWALLSGVL